MKIDFTEIVPTEEDYKNIEIMKIRHNAEGWNLTSEKLPPMGEIVLVWNDRSQLAGYASVVHDDHRNSKAWVIGDMDEGVLDLEVFSHWKRRTLPVKETTDGN